MYSFSLLNTKGELYPVFSEEEYEIVGMYQYQNISGTVVAEATEDEFRIRLSFRQNP